MLARLAPRKRSVSPKSQSQNLMFNRLFQLHFVMPDRLLNPRNSRTNPLRELVRSKLKSIQLCSTLYPHVQSVYSVSHIVSFLNSGGHRMYTNSKPKLLTKNTREYSWLSVQSCVLEVYILKLACPNIMVTKTLEHSELHECNSTNFLTPVNKSINHRDDISLYDISYRGKRSQGVLQDETLRTKS